VPLREALFLPRPGTADITAVTPRRSRLALLRAVSRTGLVTSTDRFLRLNMPNIYSSRWIVDRGAC
jgi:hypothetical protein